MGTFACPHTPHATTKRGAESTKAFVRRIPSPAAHSSQYCSSGAAKIGRVGNLIIPTDFAEPSVKQTLTGAVERVTARMAGFPKRTS